MTTHPKVGDTVKLTYPPRYSDVLECEGLVVLSESDGDFDIELADGETWTVCHQEQERGLVRVEIPAKGEVTTAEPSPPGLPAASPSGLDHWDEHRGFDRCPGSDCLVPLGTPYDSIHVCGCGAGVRLYHDGINYRMREHERYRADALPAFIPDGDLSVR